MCFEKPKNEIKKQHSTYKVCSNLFVSPIWYNFFSPMCNVVAVVTKKKNGKKWNVSEVLQE